MLKTITAKITAAIARIAEIAAVAVRAARAFATAARPLLRGFAKASVLVVMTAAIAGCGGTSTYRVFLTESIKNGNYQDAIRRIDDGANVNLKDSDGETPLYWAVIRESREVALRLLEKGAKVNARNEDGDTPLDWVMEISHSPEMALLLVENGAKMDLFVAALVGDADIVRDFIDDGADVNAKSKHIGYMPLHYAASGNAREVASLLLEKGADVNAKAEYGGTPLHNAASNNARETTLLLLEKGANVNAKNNDGNTPLHWGVGRPETARLLIENGANVNAKNNDGNTPLHWVGRPETARILIENGADVNARNNDTYTPLHYLARHSRFWKGEHGVNYAEVVKILVAHGADPESVAVVDGKSYTPVQLASLNENDLFVIALLDAGKVSAGDVAAASAAATAEKTAAEARELAEQAVREAQDSRNRERTRQFQRDFQRALDRLDDRPGPLVEVEVGTSGTVDQVAEIQARQAAQLAAQAERQQQAAQRAAQQSSSAQTNPTPSIGPIRPVECVYLKAVGAGQSFSFGSVESAQGPATLLMNQCGRPVSILYCLGGESCAPDKKSVLPTGEAEVVDASREMKGDLIACDYPYSPPANGDRVCQ